jgi:ATP-dependent protease Clp ATPase subunit
MYCRLCGDSAAMVKFMVADKDSETLLCDGCIKICYRIIVDENEKYWQKMKEFAP